MNQQSSWACQAYKQAVGVSTTRTPRPGRRPPPEWYDISGYGYYQRRHGRGCRRRPGHGSSPAGVLGASFSFFRSTVTR
eukprot:scaffold11396_cov66-Phaeocystis_antarctica.AAC.4